MNKDVPDGIESGNASYSVDETALNGIDTKNKDVIERFCPHMKQNVIMLRGCGLNEDTFECINYKACDTLNFDLDGCVMNGYLGKPKRLDVSDAELPQHGE